jgi:hypothetical protein
LCLPYCGLTNKEIFVTWQDAEELQVSVTPAEAGVRKTLRRLDSCFLRNDGPGPKRTLSANSWKKISLSRWRKRGGVRLDC